MAAADVTSSLSEDSSSSDGCSDPSPPSPVGVVCTATLVAPAALITAALAATTPVTAASAATTPVAAALAAAASAPTAPVAAASAAAAAFLVWYDLSGVV